MISLKIIRSHPKDTYTIGDLYIDYGNGEGYKFFSNTLEDKVRPSDEPKVYGKTAIPFGIYKITITFSPKFNRLLPLINNVPGFEGIRIHPGNTAEDTEGCILVGVNDQVGFIHHSKATFDELFSILKDSGQDSFTLIIE
jgi:hypothetical protein